MNDEVIQYTARWYVIVADGDTFEVHIGPKQFRPGNHQIKVIRRPDGTLRLTRYFNGTAANLTERILKRKA